MAKTADTSGDKNGSRPQDSTTRLPMVDLETAMKVVVEIRDKALETAPMPAVATALGYANATSTPFYRRITAARLFSLLSQKSAVTQEAIDYIRPHDEGTKTAVLNNAVRGIPFYAELLTRYGGKKLNLQLVANAIAKDCKLTDACALICAKAFESSLIFAGMISSDGTVLQAPEMTPKPIAESSGGGRSSEILENDRPVSKETDAIDTQAHVLFLDKGKSRRFAFSGPLEITKAEYDRICKWLEFTMLIVD